MSRIVSALYDSRAEAETARARLSSEANAANMRIIAKDTVAAIDTMKIPAKDVHSYREGVSRGGHLLVAEVPDGQDADRIVHILEQSAGVDMNSRQSEWRAQGWRGLGDAESGDRIVSEARIPQVEEELRIGKREVERGGARVRSFVRETPVEQSVSLRQEHIEVDVRSADRRLTDAELESAGLLKDRVIEVSEMREEPIITKAAIVREEVVLKKTFTERTETVRDTVRHTEVEVEEFGGDRETSRGRAPAREAGGN